MHSMHFSIPSHKPYNISAHKHDKYEAIRHCKQEANRGLEVVHIEHDPGDEQISFGTVKSCLRVLSE